MKIKILFAILSAVNFGACSFKPLPPQEVSALQLCKRLPASAEGCPGALTSGENNFSSSTVNQ